jgi:hypothetical protein
MNRHHTINTSYNRKTTILCRRLYDNGYDSDGKLDPFYNAVLDEPI